jgi:hypothetical protein
MANTFAKNELSYQEIFVVFLLALAATVLAQSIAVYFQMTPTISAKTESDEFQTEIDPDRVTVAQTTKLPAINILSRQAIFFKDDQGSYSPKKDGQLLIVNTCDQPLDGLRVVWHISTERYKNLPEGGADFMELCYALDDLEVLDSTKAYSQGNWIDISPSTLSPGESAAITAFSNGIQQELGESGFAKGQLFVVADTANGLKLKMVYGFELEPLASSHQAVICRIVELPTIENNLSGP